MQNELRRWMDLLEAPISPTKYFMQYHGNYCGPGNKGGMPIDSLDRACFKHDVEYDRSYRESKSDARLRKTIADRHFVARAMKIANDPTVSPLIRKKALFAAKYFERTIQLRLTRSADTTAVRLTPPARTPIVNLSLANATS